MSLRERLIEELDSIKVERASYASPGTYVPEEYYIKCDAKVDALDEVIYRLENLLKETEE